MYKVFMIAAGIALSFFILLSKYEDRSVMRTIDFSATVKVQERIDRSSHLRFASFVGNIMEGATFFASPEFTVIVTLILTGNMLYDRQKKRWNMWAVIIPIGLTVLVGAEIYGKTVVHHPAPPFNMIKHPTTIFPANYINEQFSYPSGHSARAVFLSILLLCLPASFISVHKKKHLVTGLLLAVYTSIVAVSRIYLGHHWFSDVVGGLLLGAACAFFAVTVLARLGKK